LFHFTRLRIYRQKTK